MYAQKLSIYDFRCFGRAVLDLQYPGRIGAGASPLSNINLILGDNGGGKSSVLRAIAIAVLAPVLLESGFVAHRMVRRPQATESLLKVDAVLGQDDLRDITGKTEVELLARFEAREGQSRDRLHLDSTPASPITDRLYDDLSPSFFMVGYGATRRVETGDFSESSARRSRGLRYQRVAGLFEDHVAVRPLNVWLRKLEPQRREEALALLQKVLPANVEFGGVLDHDEQYVFRFDGRETPFSSLSDGYKAFIGMAGDLIGHLADVCSPQSKLDEIPGIVLIDEIDLHLHPEWQRSILPTLAGAFPKLQFVCTTHSPLVASTVHKENVFVTATDEFGLATIKQIEERIYGRNAEQLLLSSYFGLNTTRPDSFQEEAKELFQQAAEGDPKAALAYLDRLAAPATKRRQAFGMEEGGDLPA